MTYLVWVAADPAEEHVHLVIRYGPTPIANIVMEPSQVLGLVDQLTGALDLIHPAPKPVYRLKVGRLKDVPEVDALWTFSCPAHEDAGIGLWHDQQHALAMAYEHLADRHDWRPGA